MNLNKKNIVTQLASMITTPHSPKKIIRRKLK